jgi:3-methyladenine DNA glycosylase AlkD
MPGVPPETVIGVRIPDLRLLAKELTGTPQSKAFTDSLPHGYYEENNLHGMLLETIKDFDTSLKAVETFLPYIDNWATCDLLTLKIFRHNLPAVYARVLVWVNSRHTYTVRFGIGVLMNHFLNDAFKPEHFDLVAGVASDEYYVNMMSAWYFATALAKQEEAALDVFTQKRLKKWVHNKAIQKAVESRRVKDDTKTLLRTLKI